MTAATDSRWRITDENGRPVNNGRLYFKRHDLGDVIAPNYLDRECAQRGCDVRRSNIAGWVCNNGSDGVARNVYLQPGVYTAFMEDANGATIAQFDVTVPEAGSLIQVHAGGAAAAPRGQDIVIRTGRGEAPSAGGGSGGAPHSPPPRIPNAASGGQPDSSNVSKAIRDLLAERDT